MSKLREVAAQFGLSVKSEPKPVPRDDWRKRKLQSHQQFSQRELQDQRDWEEQRNQQSVAAPVLQHESKRARKQRLAKENLERTIQELEDLLAKGKG